MVEVIADLAGSGAMITQRPGQDLTPEMATPSSEWSASQCKAVSSRAWLVLAEDATRLAGLNFEMAVNHLQMAADLCSQSPKRPTCRAALPARPPARSRERARAGADQWPQSAAARPCATPRREDCRPVRSPASRSRRRRLRGRSRIGVKGRPGVIAQTWPCGGSDEARRETESSRWLYPTFSQPWPAVNPLKSLAPRVGFEPTTSRLTAGCSTAELPRNDQGSRLRHSNPRSPRQATSCERREKSCAR